MSIPQEHFRRVRSFIRRDSRCTKAQMAAFNALNHFFISIESGLINFSDVFGRRAPIFLEIGFGMGLSLFNLAKIHEDKNFIGIETHKPGIGKLLLEIESHSVRNLRIVYADAIDVLMKAIPDESLDGIQLFFPDPWPKRRHHQRRLIQSNFIKLIIQKLKMNGTLHLATDWEDYAMHMLKVIANEASLYNLAGLNQFAERSCYRPIVTKFEARAKREGRIVRELQFKKI